MIAVIDRRKCASDQRICKPLRECPTSAIFWVEDEDEPLGSRMEIDPEKCDGCGICVPLCCGNCIEMRR
ncbi:MAG: 4Fe-4S binding protein [Clostridiales bacterium]|nr:4Fe-4S binding protein [Clostridiales bacterium]